MIKNKHSVPTSEYLLIQREMHYALLIKYDEFNTIQFSIL